MSINRAVVLLALAACGPKPHDVTANYYRSPDLPVGAIEVALNAPTGSLSVTINDQLLVDRKMSRKATLGGIPEGVVRVLVATGGGCEAGRVFEKEVEVVAGQTTGIVLPAPEPNTGCAVYAAIGNAGLRIAMGTLAVATAILLLPDRLRGK